MLQILNKLQSKNTFYVKLTLTTKVLLTWKKHNLLQVNQYIKLKYFGTIL